MTLPVFTAGQKPTAEALNGIYAPTYLTKAASESVTSSTALQDDNDLRVALEVGTYCIWIWLHASGAAAGDLKVAWNNTGTMTIYRGALGPQSATSDRTATTMNVQAISSTTAVTYGLDGSGTGVVREDLTVDVTVAGTLKLQWAQGTSSGTATTLSSASRMLVLPVA